jgi:hypothetical protein
MENINFFLKEQEHVIENKLLPEEITTFTNELIDKTTINNNVIPLTEELELHYKINHNVKTLSQILQYYNIQKGKMLKDEMIQILVLFETDYNNIDIVQRRLRLWKNIEELKNDSYFSKYILF